MPAGSLLGSDEPVSRPSPEPWPDMMATPLLDALTAPARGLAALYGLGQGVKENVKETIDQPMLAADKAVRNYLPKGTDPGSLQDAMLNVWGISPMAMGTLVGPSAEGWASLERKFSNLRDRNVRAEVSDDALRLTNPGFDYYNRTLGDMVKHEKLFKQYPWLKDIQVDAIYAPEKSTGGWWSRDQNKITVFYRDAEGLKDTLTHEIQHAVQDAEGWPRGTHSATAGYRYFQGEIEARDAAARRRLTDEQRMGIQPYQSQGIPQNQWIGIDNEEGAFLPESYRPRQGAKRGK